MTSPLVVFVPEFTPVKGRELPAGWHGLDARTLLLSALTILLSCTAASAQTPESLQKSLIRFAQAVEGSFGDEGAALLASLDSMSRGLAEWDRRIQNLEARAVAHPSTDPVQKAELQETLGREYMARGRVTDAIAALNTAAGLQPMIARVHILRALAYEAAQRTAEAVAAFQTAWNIDRADPAAAYLVVQRAGTFLSQADRQQALDSLAAVTRAALPRTPTPGAPFPFFESGNQADFDVPLGLPAIYADAYARMTAGAYDEALSLFQKAAQHDPLLSDPARTLPAFAEGTKALRQGSLATAQKRFQAVIAAMPESSEAHRLLGIALLADRDFESSVAALTAAARLRPTDERTRILLARALIQTGQPSKGEEVLRQTIEMLPQSSYAWRLLGLVYESESRDANAAAAYSAAALNTVAGRQRLYVVIGRLYRQALDVDHENDALAQSLRLNPNDAAAHALLGGSYRDQDRPEQAFAEYVAAMLVDRLNAEAHMGIGQLHLDAGRDAEAAPILLRLVSLRPEYAEARYALAMALLRSGNAADGSRELAEFKRLQTQQLEERRGRMALTAIKREARVQATQGAFDRAIVLWQQVIEQEPDLASNRASLAAALAGAGRLEAAAQQYEEAAKRGGSADVYSELARIYEQLGRPEDSARARARYEQARLGQVRTAADAQ